MGVRHNGDRWWDTAGAASHRWRLVPVVAVLALGLGGCVVGPDYHAPALSLPDQWSGGAATAAKPQLMRWWARFKDPVLDALMDEAATGNIEVATAQARIRQARATLRQEVGQLLPTASAAASAQRSGRASGGGGGQGGGGGGQGGGMDSVTTQYQAGFDASWELDVFGANRRAAEQASYAVGAAEADLRATLLTLVGDVASAYVDLRGDQARVALARRTAASQRATAAMTRAKFEAGSASAVDVANAEGQAASTAAGIPSLEASVAIAMHRLAVLSGRSPAELDARLKTMRAIPRPTAPVATGVPADVLTNRPDVAKAEREFAEATAAVGKAEAARYPSLTLSGSITTSASQIGDLAKGSSIAWSFGPALTVPVFNGGRLAAAVEAAGAARDQYFLAYRAAVLTALEDVENAAVSLSKARARQTSLTQAVAAYRQAAELSRSLYQSGSSSFLDVLTAERSLYSAEDALLVNTAAIATDYVALNKALGGGWDGAVDGGRPEIIDENTGPHWPRRSVPPPRRDVDRPMPPDDRQPAPPQSRRLLVGDE